MASKTEDQIERAVERQIDAIDARYIHGRLTKAEYDAAIKAVHRWAEQEYVANKRAQPGVPYVETDRETAYGATTRLSRSIRVF